MVLYKHKKARKPLIYFKSNDSQQITLNDALFGLTDREKRMLEKSWAKPFAEKIFPKIDESRFACLYSDKASRPNTPVNECAGALIIKKLLNLTDDEMVESLAFDVRFQYALHTTGFEEQPLSDKSLSLFRKRCYTYELATGTDLIYETITGLSGEMAKIMKINGQIQRMDSLHGRFQYQAFEPDGTVIYLCLRSCYNRSSWKRCQGYLCRLSVFRRRNPDSAVSCRESA